MKSNNLKNQFESKAKLLVLMIIIFLTNENVFSQQLPGRRYIDSVFSNFTVDSVKYFADSVLRDNYVAPQPLQGTQSVPYINWYNDITIYKY